MDVVTDVPTVDACETEKVLPAAEYPDAASIIRSARSPVRLVWTNSGKNETHCNDRWVVAVTRQTASAGSVLSTAIREAVRWGATVMLLTPPHCDPEDYLSAIGYVEAADQAELWAIARPEDLAALILQQPGVDHLIVTTADDAAVIDTFVRNPEIAAMRAQLELLILPRSVERIRTREPS